MKRLRSSLFVLLWPLYLIGYAMTIGCMVTAVDWPELWSEFTHHFNRARGAA
jgi:hypothetical protein